MRPAAAVLGSLAALGVLIGLVLRPDRGPAPDLPGRTGRESRAAIPAGSWTGSPTEPRTTPADPPRAGSVRMTAGTAVRTVQAPAGGLRGLAYIDSIDDERLAAEARSGRLDRHVRGALAELRGSPDPGAAADDFLARLDARLLAGRRP